jgi:hypothetical protein
MSIGDFCSALAVGAEVEARVSPWEEPLAGEVRVNEAPTGGEAPSYSPLEAEGALVAVEDSFVASSEAVGASPSLSGGITWL